MLSRFRIAHCSVVALSAAALQACSMHPLPEDVSRKNTYDIVQKLRCEAAVGLRGIPRDHPVLLNTYIGYDFDFSMEENNNAGTLADRGKLIVGRKYASSGSLTLEGTAAMERQRKTERSFRIIESLLQLSNTDCSPEARANWVYPITGAVGLQEIVSTYVGLERLTNFSKDPKREETLPNPKTDTSTGIPVVFSDVITFTTNLGAGLKPTLTLTSVVGHLRVTSASIFADATRKDTHKVTVALARGGDPDHPADRETRASRVQDKEMEYVNRLSAFATYNNPRLARTLDAVFRKGLPPETHVLIELERRRGLSEEEIFSTKLLEILKPPP